MKNIASVATIAFALLLAWGSSSAEAAKNILNIDFDKCALAAVDHLGQFGVKKDDVTDYNFVEVAEGGRSGLRIVGLEYWLRVKQCESGSVIIDMNESCTVRSAYTRRGCKVEGLRSFR